MLQFSSLNSTMETRDHSKNGACLKSLMSKKNIMQKTVLFFAALCVSVASTFAQDIITLKNGEDIQVLVQEIGEVDVKYKKFDNPNGPNYTLKKSEIFMIRYANGSKDVFADNAVPVVETTPIPITKQPSIQNNKGEIYYNFWGVVKYRSDHKKLAKEEFENLIYSTPESSKSYRSGKTWNTVGGAFSGGGGALIGYNIATLIMDDTYNPTTLYVGCGMVVVGTIFSSIGSSNMRTAVDIYNASVRRQQTSDISLNFGITQSGGIGLTLNF